MTDYVPGFGPLDAEWAIVGEAPGREERRQGQPFVGPSGRLLRESLERVGLDPDKAYITNVYKEYRDGNPTPTPAEIEAARAELSAELSHLPNLRGVLLLGNTPLRAFTGKTAITKNRGHYADPLVGGVPVFATLHPAAILRSIRYKSDWLNDLATFAASINNVEDDVKVHIIQNYIGLVAMEADMLIHDGIGALDVETTIADRIEDAQLVTVAVSFDGKTAWALRSDKEYFRKGLTMLSKGKWIMHNGSFDLMMLRAHTNMEWTLHQDTMAMAYLLKPEERKGLEILSGVWLGLPPYKEVDYKNIMEEDWDEVATMNGRDAARTLKLFRPLADELNLHPHLSRTYQWLLKPAISALVDITLRGVPVDLDRLGTLRTQLEEALSVERAALQEMAGDPLPSYGKETWSGKEFNPGSTQQVAHVLYDKMGYPILEKTDTGAPSTGAAVLEKLMEQDPSEFLTRLLDWRSANKMLTAFINSWTDLLGSDGRLHPRYKPTQVVTGRLAAEKPNIQQVPRSSEYRRVFGGVEGYTWIKADLSQIELRIAAWLAEEESMIAAYQAGADLHALTASLVFGVEDVTTEWKPGRSARDAGKMLNFSLLYGAFPSKLKEIAQRQYGMMISDNEAAEYRAIFFESYPRLARWHAEVKATVRETGQIASPLGRVRTFPEVASEDEWEVRQAEREAINHPVQSFASDILLSSLVRLPDDVRQYAIAEVHDELDFLVPHHEVERVIPIVKATMEDLDWLKRWGIQLSVPVLADVEAKGDYWA